MIHVAGHGLRTIQTEWLGGVGVVLAQVLGEAVDRGGAVHGHELGFSGRVGGHRIGGEVMVERHVLLEDHHHVLDRGGGGVGLRGGHGNLQGGAHGQDQGQFAGEIG